MRRSLPVVAVVVLLVLSGCSALDGNTTQATTNDGNGTDQAGTTTTPQQPTDESGTQATACNYASLYEQTIDSVVSVKTNSGLGSGFVYQTMAENNTGYIVTNAHVVGSADTVLVQFAREDSRTGVVVGRDRYSDLAVIRVSDMPSYAEALPVANSAPVQGQRVAALGSPFGLDETITHGIISGLNRSLSTDQGFTMPNVVQTDAPISSGNSGGPLVTCDGTVVGVNTAGLAARRAENIGFAVPATVVSEVVPELVDDGDAEHAFLGVAATRVTTAIAEANDLNTTEGAYVTAVGEGTPAAGTLRGATDVGNVSGTRVPVGGDVIVAADGRSIESPQDLKEFLLLEAQPGDAVTLTVLRNGERTNVTVTLGERPEPGTD